MHVADFGVASAAHLGAMTETGTVVGTAGYLARAGAGRAGDSGERPLRARGGRLRAPDGDARYATRDGRGARARKRTDPAGLAAPSRPAARGGRRPRPRSRQGAGDRYAAAADLVDALRAALDDAAGPTRVQPAPRPPCGSRRGAALDFLPLLALVLLGAGILAATLLAGGDDEPTATPTAPQTIRETIMQTVTTPAPTTSRRPRNPRPRNPRPRNPRPRNPRPRNPRRRRLPRARRAERRGLRADAGGRLRVRAAAPRAGRAALVGLRRARRSLRELQPRLHPGSRSDRATACSTSCGAPRRSRASATRSGDSSARRRRAAARGTTEASSRADPRTALVVLPVAARGLDRLPRGCGARHTTSR